jgi:PKD repeat protein
VTLAGGSATITAATVNNGSNDNCGVQSVSVSKTSFNCSNIGANSVTLTVTDIHGNVGTCTATVTVVGEVPTCNITSVPENNIYTGGVPTNIYLGYGPQSTTLQVAAPATGAPYTYAWSGGVLSNYNTANPVFSPTAAGTYTFTVIVTNKYGCTASCSITIHVYDVRVPGSKGKKVYLCHAPNGNPSNDHTLEISVNAVPAHLENHDGDHLGQCDLAIAPGARVVIVTEAEAPVAVNAKIYPNPNRGSFELQLSNYKTGKLEVRVINRNGAVIESRPVVYNGKSQVLKFNLKATSPGLYYVQIISKDGTESLKLVLDR